MLDRCSARVVQQRLTDSPAVVLVGPRQCGKTTLAKTIGGSYFDLEQPTDQVRLDLAWPTLAAGKRLVILDEAQAWPEIFQRLRGAIDRDRKRNGRFLLLGSVSPSLMTQVSESLAGRLAIVELPPLIWAELETKASQERLWLCGGFPDGGVLTPARFPQWQDDYVTLLVQRDLPNWGLPARPSVTRRLVRMLAAMHGQVWNASQLGQSLGLNYQTINGYADYLEGAFFIRRLGAYHGNLRKRLVKSPKLYLRDSGLLHALRGVDSRDALLTQPWLGASWEGFVIEQILGALAAAGRRFEAFHLRTSDQHEIDLVLELSGRLSAIEIKLTSRPHPEDVARLDKTADWIAADQRYLVSQTAAVVAGGRTVSCNLPWLLDRLLH